MLLSAPGLSAIAVIRLVGPCAQAWIERHFSRPVVAGRPVYGQLTDGPAQVDDPVVIWQPSTQTVDICTHGGRWVMHAVLELAQREGFELVEARLPLPPEAVDAGDELEREILQYLPLARTKEAIQTLLNQKQAWAALLSDKTAAVSDRRKRALGNQSLHWLLYPPRIAILGVPNAGKSTLANAIFGRQRSIVADLPGTTRDYVEDFANLSGMPAMLVDTPGLRHSADSIETQAIAISRDQIALADLQILLLDPTQDAAAQEEMITRYPNALLVLGKSDAVSSSPQALSTKYQAPLRISAKTGQGLPDLDLTIRRQFGCETLPHNRPCVWTERQRQLLTRT